MNTPLIITESLFTPLFPKLKRMNKYLTHDEMINQWFTHIEFNHVQLSFSFHSFNKKKIKKSFSCESYTLTMNYTRSSILKELCSVTQSVSCTVVYCDFKLHLFLYGSWTSLQSVHSGKKDFLFDAGRVTLWLDGYGWYFRLLKYAPVSDSFVATLQTYDITSHQDILLPLVVLSVGSRNTWTQKSKVDQQKLLF